MRRLNLASCSRPLPEQVCVSLLTGRWRRGWWRYSARSSMRASQPLDLGMGVCCMYVCVCVCEVKWVGQV